MDISFKPTKKYISENRLIFLQSGECTKVEKSDETVKTK